MIHGTGALSLRLIFGVILLRPTDTLRRKCITQFLHEIVEVEDARIGTSSSNFFSAMPTALGGLASLTRSSRLSRTTTPRDDPAVLLDDVDGLAQRRGRRDHVVDNRHAFPLQRHAHDVPFSP